MRWSSLTRGALVTAPAMLAAVLVGAQPASADITVDSAVCLNHATATVSADRPDGPDVHVAYLSWWASVDTTYCHAANASLLLVHNNKVLRSSSAASGGYTVTEWGWYTLRVATSMGSKDIISVSVTGG
jgi:hypothetical protein